MSERGRIVAPVALFIVCALAVVACTYWAQHLEEQRFERRMRELEARPVPRIEPPIVHVTTERCECLACPVCPTFDPEYECDQ